MADLQSADTILRAALTQADRVVTLADPRGRAALREVLRALKDANAALERRLWRSARSSGGANGTFGQAQAQAYRVQLQPVIAMVQRRLSGLTVAASTAAARVAYPRTMALLRKLDRAFTGSVAPLRLGTASQVSRALRGLRSSRLVQTATSMDRYGDVLVHTFERSIQRGLLMGSSQSEMIDALVGHGGPTGIVSTHAVEVSPGVIRRVQLRAIPEGLFWRHRYWAARLVRTEVATAQNGAALEAMRIAQGTDFPDLQRKILAMMDKRTATDSLGVHGQIRGLEDPFTDGAGRVYLNPPARPNDREVIVPWHPDWPETPLSRRLPASVRARAQRPAGRWRDLPLHWGVPADGMES